MNVQAMARRKSKSERELALLQDMEEYIRDLRQSVKALTRLATIVYREYTGKDPGPKTRRRSKKTV